MEWNYVILGIFILIASYIDIKHHKIPNWLSISGLVVGILYYIINLGLEGILFSFIGMFVGGGIMFILYIFKGVGAGDVKLFAAIGAMTGIEFTLYNLMYSIVFAGLIGIVILVIKRKFFLRLYHLFSRFIGIIRDKNLEELDEFKEKEAIRFPFMYAVLPGTIMTLYYFMNL